jgi:hypothetical protein
MNRFVKTLLLVTICGLLFSACKKATVDTSEPSGKMDAIITANKWVNGNQWSSTGASCIGYMGQTPYGYTKTLVIAATKTSGTALNGAVILSIDNYKDTATTYYIDNVNNLATYLEINGKDTIAHAAASGVINITSGNATAAYGYFNFTTNDQILVNNGIFNVNIATK